MAFSRPAIDEGLLALVVGRLWLHLHTGTVSAGNLVTYTGYNPVAIDAADWELATVDGWRRIRNRFTRNWPTPGSDAGDPARFVGMWTKQSLAENPADPPGLVRAFPITEQFTAETNGAIQAPPGALYAEVEIRG